MDQSVKSFGFTAPSAPRFKPRAPARLWFEFGAGAAASLLDRVLETEFAGVVFSADELDRFAHPRFSRLDRVIRVEDAADWRIVAAGALFAAIDAAPGRWIIASADDGVLDQAAAEGLETCLSASIADGADLARVVATGGRRDAVALSFKDPTNIPLELVIAAFQASSTAVVKAIADAGALDDIAAALGTMEVGADGLIVAPCDAGELDRLLAVVRRAELADLTLEPAEIESSRPIGMGHRACIDLVTLFEPTEGLLIGSTSQGGLLCCPEVFELPYMDKRPFRVNAGGVHGYLFDVGEATHYLSELRAGMTCQIVGLDGRARAAPIGRIKIERRPLRLLTARFAGGEAISLILQDDWHVRVYGADGSARNITTLKPGEAVLAHRSTPGRHVGIPVDEFIREC